MRAVGDGPARFEGPAHALKGELRLANSGGERSILRSVRAELAGASASARVFVVLEPGAERDVPIVFAAPDAPAGEQLGRVSTDGQSVAAVFVVVAVRRVRFVPARIDVRGGRGQRVVRTVQVHNQGTAALTPDRESALVLARGDRVPIGVLPMLPGVGIVPVPAASDGARRASVRLAGPSIEPGAEATLKLAITLPSDLEPGAYVGELPVLGGRLRVDVTVDP